MTLFRLVSVVVAMVAFGVFCLYRTEVITVIMVLERSSTQKVAAAAHFGAVNLQFYPPPPPPSTLANNNDNNNDNNNNNMDHGDNNNKNSQHDHDKTIFFPTEYRLMRLTNPSPKLGKRIVNYQSHGPTPRHQCAGVEYDDYMKRAAQMVNRRAQLLLSVVAEGENNTTTDVYTSKRLSASRWGKRPTILPNNNNNNNKGKPYQILMLGNSETRQVAEALEWQYHDQVNTVSDLEITFKKEISNATISKVINHGAFYSPRWKQNLEEFVLGKPIKDYDAIVLGVPNPYNPQYKNSRFWTNIRKYATKHKEQQVDIVKYPQAFGLIDLMDVYDGPIIFLSSWHIGITATRVHNASLELILNASSASASASATRENNRQRRRTNLRYIDSRAATVSIGGGECGYDDSGLVAICNATLMGHRCFGDKGGQADFVAWDLIEALYDILG